MKCVIVESPYAGDVAQNLAYVRACMADCLRRGEAPFASHALYTQPGVLDDALPLERVLGTAAGYEWTELARCVVFYIDLGWSPGMLAALNRSHRLSRFTRTPRFTRTLGHPWSDLARSSAVLETLE